MKRSDVVSKINSLNGESGHKWVVNTYNSISPRPRGYKLQQTDPWCAATVSAVFHSLGCDDFAECSCPVMIQKAKELGIWQENDAYKPKVGDVLMYDWQDTGKGDNMGVADHVGIVVKVNGDTLTVREGNKNGTVGNRTVKVNGKNIRGYITPHFEDDSATISDKPTNTTPSAEKPSNEADSASKQGKYIIGRTYTINVRTSLNVRRGAGTNYALVGYNNLTADAKRHATSSGALMNGTRVTCKEVKVIGNDVWMRIPSGWICAIAGNNVYVK